MLYRRKNINTGGTFYFYIGRHNIIWKNKKKYLKKKRKLMEVYIRKIINK